MKTKSIYVQTGKFYLKKNLILKLILEKRIFKKITCACYVQKGHILIKIQMNPEYEFVFVRQSQLDQ